MKVAVFGGASAKPGETVYEDARRLGVLLATAGYTVMTGGYIGVMEAASRGANTAGGHVIGVTCKEIERWRGTGANPWVKEEWSFETLRERMYALIDACDAAVVMPGGVGTLAELAVMWNEQIINGNPFKPLILVGEGWQDILEHFFTDFGGFIKPPDRALVQIVPDISAVMTVLQ